MCAFLGDIIYKNEYKFYLVSTTDGLERVYMLIEAHQTLTLMDFLDHVQTLVNRNLRVIFYVDGTKTD